MKIVRGCGCPICGYNYSSWSLLAQKAHVVTAHRWWQRLALRRRTGLPLIELLLQRKYRVGKP